MAKPTTQWKQNPLFTGQVRLDSTTVTLGSLTVTLLGFTAGTHFLDNRNNTDFAPITKNKTDFTPITKNTTDFTNYG